MRWREVLNEGDYGSLIDPFNGAEDISLQVIKTPLDPDQTFSDDPLRMMRAIRFASQLEFTIEENTWQGIINNIQRIQIISQERITDELNKISGGKTPSVGFDLLIKVDYYILFSAQMVELAGAEYKDGMGHKDNFYHTLQVLDNIAIHPMICGCAGRLSCMILPSRPPKNLKKDMAGLFMDTKWWVEEWCLKFLPNSTSAR